MAGNVHFSYFSSCFSFFLYCPGQIDVLLISICCSFLHWNVKDRPHLPFFKIIFSHLMLLIRWVFALECLHLDDAYWWGGSGIGMEWDGLEEFLLEGPWSMAIPLFNSWLQWMARPESSSSVQGPCLNLSLRRFWFMAKTFGYSESVLRLED